MESEVKIENRDCIVKFNLVGDSVLIISYRYANGESSICMVSGKSLDKLREVLKK